MVTTSRCDGGCQSRTGDRSQVHGCDFILYFLWKREWRMALASSLAAIVFSLAPMLLMGPQRYVDHMRTWLTNLREASALSDPTQGLLGDEPVANKSLRPALGRYLVRLPEGHLARFDHPAYVDFLDLSPSLAHRVVQGVLVLLLGGVAWSLSGRIRRFLNEVAYECEPFPCWPF